MAKLLTYSRLVREQATIHRMTAEASAKGDTVLVKMLRKYANTLARLCLQKGDFERRMGKENV